MYSKLEGLAAVEKFVKMRKTLRSTLDQDLRLRRVGAARGA